MYRLLIYQRESSDVRSQFLPNEFVHMLIKPAD